MKNKVQIQSIGKVNGKQAINFKKGEKMLWNFGYKSEVLDIVSETAKFITFKLNSVDPFGKTSGEIYERRLKKDRLVAIA